MARLSDTSGILSLNSPGTMITFIVTQTIPGTPTYSSKDQEYGAGERVCPDEPQKCLTGLAQWLKTPPLHLYPQNPPNPR